MPQTDFNSTLNFVYWLVLFFSFSNIVQSLEEFDSSLELYYNTWNLMLAYTQIAEQTSKFLNSRECNLISVVCKAFDSRLFY